MHVNQFGAEFFPWYVRYTTDNSETTTKDPELLLW